MDFARNCFYFENNECKCDDNCHLKKEKRYEK